MYKPITPKIAPTILAMLLLTQPAFAAAAVPAASAASPVTQEATAVETHFADVPASHPYAREIGKAWELGIVAGTGSDSFVPDRAITLYETLILLTRAYTVEGASSNCYQAALDSNIVHEWDLQSQENTPQERDSFFEKLFRAANIQTWDARLVEGAVTAGHGADFDTALAMGLTNPWESYPSTQITRAEAVAAVIRLLESNQIPPRPDIMSDIQVVIECPIDYVNEALLNLEQQTQKTRAAFADNGWKIVFGEEHIKQFTAEHHIMAAGLHSPADKTIYLNSGLSFNHEFGHFIDRQTGFLMEDYFEMEKDSLAEVAGSSYCTTNEREFAAVAMACYMNNRADAEYIGKLMKAIPQTYAVICQLVEEGWLPPLACTLPAAQ